MSAKGGDAKRAMLFAIKKRKRNVFMNTFFAVFILLIIGSAPLCYYWEHQDGGFFDPPIISISLFSLIILGVLVAYIYAIKIGPKKYYLVDKHSQVLCGLGFDKSVPFSMVESFQLQFDSTIDDNTLLKKREGKEGVEFIEFKVGRKKYYTHHAFYDDFDDLIDYLQTTTIVELDEVVLVDFA